MSYLSENYPNYDVDEFGNIYKNGNIITPYNTRGDYLQVYLYDKNHKGKLFGVYVVVAMKYLDYYEGCIIHHKDENKMNNHVSNLEVISRSDHSRQHMTGNTIAKEYYKTHESKKKGTKITDPKYLEKLSIAQKKRIKREGPRKFVGNQFKNTNGKKIIVPIIFDDPMIKSERKYYNRNTKAYQEYEKIKKELDNS
jgi:hypothetical protein